MKRNTKGFTLIELLIVVVIIGILAAIAIPKFASTKNNAYLATVKTDLRNLATAEEGYASNNNGNYFAGTITNPIGGPAPVGVAATGFFVPSAGVSVVVVLAAPGGWSAVGTHSLATSYPGGTGKCAIYVNTTAVAPAVNEGVPTC